jgi:HAD superfamily hydrolase (TIGR01459 family)
MLSNTDDFRSIAGLEQISGDYDAILCDIWGVVHNGRMPFDGAIEALQRYREERGPVILISNSPRPSVAIPAQFTQVGIDAVFYDAIVTSGDATIDELSRRAPGPAFKLGPERDDRIYEGLELHFADIDDAAFISCTGLFEDDHETPEDYRELLSKGVENGIPMVCANPDVTVKVDGRTIYCGGALAELYANLGGEVVFAGKPHPPIYRLARAWMQEVAGHVPHADRVLMIGDNIFTDLIGAEREGYGTLYIQDGLHGRDAELAAVLRKYGIRSDYIAPQLVW